MSRRPPTSGPRIVGAKTPADVRGIYGFYARPTWRESDAHSFGDRGSLTQLNASGYLTQPV